MMSGIPYIKMNDILVAQKYNKDVSWTDADKGLIPYFNARFERPYLCYGSFEQHNPGLVAIQEAIDEMVTESLNLSKIDLFATNEPTIQKRSEEFKKILDERENGFCNRLQRADFEDGYDNDVIDEVRQYMNYDKYVTMAWLNGIYGTNQKNPSIIAGLLRIISSVASEEDIKYFIPLIKCGLQDSHVECQEAALMAVEVLGTKECIEAIETSTFVSPMIRGYAEVVLESLKEKLGYVVENVR